MFSPKKWNPYNSADIYSIIYVNIFDNVQIINRKYIENASIIGILLKNNYFWRRRIINAEIFAFLVMRRFVRVQLLLRVRFLSANITRIHERTAKMLRFYMIADICPELVSELLTESADVSRLSVFGVQGHVLKQIFGVSEFSRKFSLAHVMRELGFGFVT